MPRTLQTSGPAFRIEVAAPPGWTYGAGDTVIGNVVRQLPIVTPEATVTLSLLGRLKTKITVRRNDNTYRYRGRWQLLAPQRTIIFRGPLHIPEGSGASWPYSITIPTRPNSSVVQGHFKKESFLPLDEESIPPELPGTFFSEERGFSTSSEAFIEYYLEAHLQYIHGGSPKTNSATFPLTIRGPVTDPFLSFQPNQNNFNKEVRSQRLLPGMEHAELSFKQKSRKLFHSSKVPVLAYTVQITSPRVIQLDNPSPIPFIISITEQDKTSLEIRDVAHTFKLNWVQIKIRSSTRVLAPGNWFDNAHNDNHTCVQDLRLENVFRDLENPVTISTAKGNEVDLGSLFQLVLGPRGLTAGGRHLTTMQTIQPDFVTYNIRHSNSLHWVVSLTVAGEPQKVEMTSGIKILPSA